MIEGSRIDAWATCRPCIQRHADTKNRGKKKHHLKTFTSNVLQFTKASLTGQQ
jgi:hypothetical protein